MATQAPTTPGDARFLAIIGDLVASRAVPNRQDVQSRLNEALAGINGLPGGIASPYTLTLGDEFQAVLRDAGRVFQDAVRIQASVHPVLVRFSLGVGVLTTAVNPRQALGMDGPAFHLARDGIHAMKADETTLFHVDGLDPDTTALCNASLSLVSHAFSKWHTRRFHILAALQQETPVPDIARKLHISEQAVYKNISDGRLRDVLAVFTTTSTLVNRTLRG